MEVVELQRYLVIANETVGGDDLVDEVRRRAQQDRTAVHVVVPATIVVEEGGGADSGVAGGGPVSATSFGDPGSGAGTLASGTTGHVTRDITDLGGGPAGAEFQARILLKQVTARLEPLVDQVTGEVGSSDPVEAAEQAVRAERYDGVILATPPAGPSKVVGQDLPSRIERVIDCPLTTVNAARSNPRAAE